MAVKGYKTGSRSFWEKNCSWSLLPKREYELGKGGKASTLKLFRKGAYELLDIP